ncbi:MAG TPA: calcium/proton exchanger [Syntrophomonadaceae bacterium]|nr:calcium/proton exchanger [Syntrophomonadaceae bacterium]
MGRFFYLLLAAIPVSIYGKFADHPTLMFFSACLAIIPLAGIMGKATESLASYTGERVGGFINATFGNATELLITVFALQAGLYDVVKASIAGSIMGNILLVLGLAILAGGLKNGSQSFDRVHVNNQTSLMFLAVIALIIPAVFFASPGQADKLGNFSVVVAAILLLIYLSGLVFAIKRSGGTSEIKSGRWSRSLSVVLLGLTTVVIAIESELLVAGIESVTHLLGWSTFFIGIVIIPIIGNAAEHFTAVLMAWKNKIDLAFEIAVGSSTQMAMLITPLLVFLGLFLNRPMNIMFNFHEIVSVALAVLIAQFVSLDGESNWLEGSLLVAAYAIMAIAFYFI